MDKVLCYRHISFFGNRFQALKSELVRYRSITRNVDCQSVNSFICYEWRDSFKFVDLTRAKSLYPIPYINMSSFLFLKDSYAPKVLCRLKQEDTNTKST